MVPRGVMFWAVACWAAMAIGCGDDEADVSTTTTTGGTGGVAGEAPSGGGGSGGTGGSGGAAVPGWSLGFGDAQDQGATNVAVDAEDNLIVAGSFSGSIDFGGGPLTVAGS